MLEGGNCDHECQLLKEHLFPAGSTDNAFAHQGAGEAIHHGPRELIDFPSAAGGGHLERGDGGEMRGWWVSGGRLFIWLADMREPGGNIFWATGHKHVRGWLQLRGE